MMSMSMYQRRKQSSFMQKPITSAKRSNSVPVNLSEDAQDFMSSVVEQSIIPEDRAISSAQLADSIRSEDDDFFCPMDDNVDVSEEQRNDSSTKQQVTKLVEQQQRRQAALVQLEEFFLGESSSVTKQASPVSVIDVSPAELSSKAGLKPSPKRNMFGQVMEEASAQWSGLGSLTHTRTKSADSSGFFLEVQADEDVASVSTKDTDSTAFRAFTRLNPGDRALSLPLECMAQTGYGNVAAPVPILTKKPSLKKISSFGHGMHVKKTTSEGSLQRAVSFSSLSIREYPPAISDNPSCSFGPPVQLDWDYEAEETQTIDHYEESRQPRRAAHDLLLSYYDRRFLLLKQAGYTRREVKEAEKEAERVKRGRMVTDLLLPVQALDETMENVVDTVKRFFSGGAKNQGVV